MSRLRVLLCRPDHLGDVLLALPAAALLRRALPDAQLTFVAAPGMSDLLRRCPDLDDVQPLSFPPPNSPAEPPGWAQVVRTASADLRGRFDASLLLRPDDPWSGALTSAADIPVRLGFDQPRTRPFLTRALPEPTGCHVRTLGVALAAALLEHFGRVTPEGAVDARLSLTAGDRCEAAALVEDLGVGPRPVVVHPGSGWKLKNWPVGRWGEVLGQLRRRHGVTPLVLGSSGEAELVEAVVAASGGAGVCGGQLSMGGLAALHAGARLVVTTDSGAAHLAAMVGAPLVVLFGPGDPVGFRPCCDEQRLRVLRVGLPCSPCGTLENPPCGAVTNPDCVTGITVDTVLNATESLLAATADLP